MWSTIARIMSWTGIRDITVWQDLVFSVVLIPTLVLGIQRLCNWWDRSRPVKQLLNGFLCTDTEVLVFVAQLSAWNREENHIAQDRWYVSSRSSPVPQDGRARELFFYTNIDPMWSETDGECLADVYNVLGKAGRTGGLGVGDLIEDWQSWTRPTVSIGFNPRSWTLMERCDPIWFEHRTIEPSGQELEIAGVALNDTYPDDAAVLQKTSTREGNTPVFILAGLGTTGTSSAGYYLAHNYIELGKLYGRKPFCLLLKCRTDEGRESGVLVAAYPRPPWYKGILHPRLYQRLADKFISLPETGPEQGGC